MKNEGCGILRIFLIISAIGIWVVLLVQAPGPILLVTIVGLFAIGILKRK